MTRLAITYPIALWAGIPCLLVLVWYHARSLMARGHGSRGTLLLTACRAVALALMVFLLARPVWRQGAPKQRRPDEVALLIDRSASMSLHGQGPSRYRQAVTFTRDALVPQLSGQNLQLRPYLFAADVHHATGRDLATARVDGGDTDIAGAIVQSIADAPVPPRAILVLTDGVATISRDNRRALSLLTEHHIPLVGVAIGQDSEAQVLSVDSLDLPRRVGTNKSFAIDVTIRATGNQTIPEFSLLLTSNGKRVDQRRVAAGTGPRIWRERFHTTCPQVGLVEYRVQLQLADNADVRVTRNQAAGIVRVADDQTTRVLFVQGALTWNYKFIRLALRGDDSIVFAGLSRAASGSQLYQSVEDSEDLAGGFPATIKQMARFQVIILSDVGPADLTRKQQQLIDQYCSRYGGGVLMIGGPSTFTSQWSNTQMEQLLPVRFPSATTARAPDSFRSRPISPRDAQANYQRITPTAAGRRYGVLHLADQGDPLAAWLQLPGFAHIAPVRGVKPGAELWLQTQPTPGEGSKPVMIAQRYGAGRSAVICVQNLWRWRLDRTANPAHFDRFCRQLIRFLAHAELNTLSIHLASDDLRTDRDVQLVVEQRVDAQHDLQAPTTYTFEIHDAQGEPVKQQQIQVQPGTPVRVTFRSADAGTFRASLLDPAGAVCAARSFTLADLSSEFVRTARDLSVLRQWAGLSGGLAMKLEEQPDATALLDRIREAVQRTAQQEQTIPAGINGWMLGCLLLLLGVEYGARKIWSLR